ncbi:MAG: hypothetical protein C5S38_02350 [Candidatus Methanophagaceae archaeon]|nr:MAG: hypothetical protein C5S38_02350 [Methanophagales archaeon]KAF5432650.1 hypothetical protein C5S36_08105 [Methanophagales archaeon]
MILCTSFKYFGGNIISNNMADTSQTRDTMPIAEKIGLAFALLVAVIVLGVSLFSLIIDLVINFNLYGIVIDLIFVGIGIFLGYFCIRMYKKTAYHEKLMDTAFDQGIYERLEPVLRKVAETQVEMESLEGRLGKIDHMVQTVIDEQVKGESSPVVEVERSIIPGTSMGFVVKSIFLTIITMSGFLFMIYTPPGPVHLVTLMFYLLWWMLITSEFKLFEEIKAWTFLFISILIVPTGFMLLNILDVRNPNTLLALFYACLALYALLYYSWAVYVTKGTVPFNLDFIRNIKRK